MNAPRYRLSTSRARWAYSGGNRARIERRVVAALRRSLAAGDGRLAAAAGGLSLEAPAVEQLRPGSDLVEGLAVGWQRALREGAAGPLATGTRILTIGGSRDQVVAADRSSQPDPDLFGPVVADEPEVLHRVLPGGHGSVPETEAARQVVWGFLADRGGGDSPGKLSTLVSREQGLALRMLGGAIRLHDLYLGPWPSR